MAYPDNLLRIRNNGKIKPIDISEDKLQYLKDTLASNQVGPHRKRGLMKDTIGMCCICGAIPTMMVSYDMQGATLNERYCDKCVKTVYEREPVL